MIFNMAYLLRKFSCVRHLSVMVRVKGLNSKILFHINSLQQIEQEVNKVKRLIELIVNGMSYEIAVDTHRTLLEVLRDTLGFTGTKNGCDQGECGSCTVLIDGKAVHSCLTLAMDVQGKHIETIEGLSEGEKLHPIQQSFVDHGAIQCGFCTPGMIMSSKAMLDKNPSPAEDEIKRGISGNLCRCTGYVKIVDAIKAVAAK
ncbi:4-hydroxybenzoyl-CoA reductase subunit gamma (modular protein) [uncultured Desulfobacterium sp.]|uniref:4-hydroxybenzoyl-CoA reductase subunit gamma (Modular protein) n=1 Tax=uncultured Desulfobacterium sp. TaxID=201089 RepID=A0A445MXT6_9BACT|nr:4-hydroxybenzoyl-CoA reductase subunit gamma (modular protein) [uncultured Desulfobacterium sp.]